MRITPPGSGGGGDSPSSDVEKEDINLSCTESSFRISVDTENRKCYKELDLPEVVEPKSARATYKNGVLIVTIDKGKPKLSEERISIE